jgi:hypothetical protein
MRLLVSLLAAGLSCAALAQDFQKTYRMNTNGNRPQYLAEGTHLLEANDGGYLVAGHRPIGNQRAPYLLKVNAQGDSLWSKTYNYWSEGRPFAFYRSPMGAPVLAVSAYQPAPERRAILLRINEATGDTLRSRTLPKHQRCNSQGEYHALHWLPDSSLILSYRDLQPGGGNASNVGHLYKINAAGQLGWQYENDGSNASYQVFYELMWDGSHLVGAGIEADGTHSYIPQWVVTRLDTAGQLDWTTTVLAPTSSWNRWTGLATCLLQNAQGDYLVGGKLKFQNPKLPTEGVVIRLGPNGDSLAAYRVPMSRGINDLRWASNSSGPWVATGTGLVVDSSGPAVEYYDKALLAVGQNQGTVLSTQHFGDSLGYPSGFGTTIKARYYGNALLQDSQGRWLVTGMGFRNAQNDQNKEMTYLLRQASLGIGLPEPRAAGPAWQLFPQPAGKQVWLKSHNPDAAPLRLYDLSGALLHQGRYRSGDQLDLRGLKPGRYLLRWHGRSGLLLRE